MPLKRAKNVKIPKTDAIEREPRYDLMYTKEMMIQEKPLSKLVFSTHFASFFRGAGR